MANEPSDKKQKQETERSRQVGVSFPVDRMIEDQLKLERAEAEIAKKRQMERTRPEVYGMPVDTIIESAKKAYPPTETIPEQQPEEPIWTSIEDQMANPMGGKTQSRRKKQR